MLVDDLDHAVREAQAKGAVITRAPAQQEVGRNVTVTFSSAPTIEFVEWDQATREATGL